MSIYNAGLLGSELEGFYVSEMSEINGRTIFKDTKCKAKLAPRGTVIGTVLNRHAPSRLSFWSEESCARVPYFPFLLVI